MPIYEYQCDGCGDVFEVRQRMSDPAPQSHACGSKQLHRVLSATSFVLKGTGWYATDYGNRSAPPKEDGGGGGGDKADKASADGGADKAAAPAKDGTAAPAAKADGKAAGGASSTAAPAAGASPKPKGGGSPAAA